MRIWGTHKTQYFLVLWKVITRKIGNEWHTYLAVRVLCQEVDPLNSVLLVGMLKLGGKKKYPNKQTTSESLRFDCSMKKKRT